MCRIYRRNTAVKVATLFFLFLGISFAKEIPLEATKVCKQCHPLIYKEFTSSMHAKASIFNDPVHKAVWDKHPAKKKGNYKCKKCHTPVDTKLSGLPQKNDIQEHSPISCVYCHRIEDVKYHPKSNENILSEKKNTLYGARKSLKGNKDVEFEKEKSFFGLVTKQSGSPYHHIDFSNDNYYSAKTCMGCHSHKQNGKGFNVCDMQQKEQKNKKNCIECHMPKIKGSFTTLQNAPTHRFHGFAGVSNNEEMLARYVKLKLQKQKNGFVIQISNEAPHDLFLHPMRMAELRVTVYRNSKALKLPPKRFQKIIGKNGKPSAPWVAEEIVKDTQIKANQTRDVEFLFDLQKKDYVEALLGFYKVSPKMAKKLGITDENVTKFKILKKLEEKVR